MSSRNLEKVVCTGQDPLLVGLLDKIEKDYNLEPRKYNLRRRQSIEVRQIVFIVFSKRNLKSSFEEFENRP